MAETAEIATPSPPKPGEVRVDVAALNGSEQQAAEALSGLFEAEPNSEISTQGEGSAAEVEQVEKPAIDNTEDGHSEPPETGAIEPPDTWTAKEKQQFDALPPEAKAAIEPFLRRDRERDALLSTQSRKAAEEAKQTETLRQSVATERAQQAQLLQGVLLQLNPELQRFANIDWAKLAAEKPAEWAQQRQAYEDITQRINAAQGYVNVLQQQQRAETDKQRKEFLATEQQRLIAIIPEFADPIKGKALAKDISDTLTEIKPEEWGAIADHRYLLIARDAMLYRKAVAARAAAQKKQVPASQSNVRTLKPVARQPGAGEDAQQRQVSALHENLRKTGSHRDAAAVMVAAGLFGKA